MKNYLLSLLFLLTCFGMASTAQAADTYVTIGSESEKSTHFPMAINWKYNMTQQIYTIGEIGRGGSIKSIAFRLATNTSRTRNIDLYLVNTDKSTFESKTDWINVSPYDKVFSGDVTFLVDDWTTITLDKAFDYYGFENLAVIVHDRTGQFINSSNSFQSYDAGSRQGIYVYNDNAAYSPTDMNGRVTAQGLDTQKNRIRLGFDSGIVQIGNGASSISHVTGLPLNTEYRYSLSQQIYTKEEIGKSGTITSLSFYFGGGAMDDMTRKINLYVQGVGNKSSFTSTNSPTKSITDRSNDFVSSSKANLVFSGRISMNDTGWYTIPFSKPFTYSGDENLLVTVEDFTGTYTSEYYQLVFTAQSQAIHVSNNSSPYDITGDVSSLTGRRESYKNPIRFEMEEVQKTPIDKIEISGFTAPQYGEHPSYDLTVPDDAHYFIMYISWVRNWEPSADLNIVGGDKTFNSTTDAYTDLIWVKAKEGYEITNATKVFINGSTDLVDILSFGGAEWCIRTKPFYVNKPYTGGVIDFNTGNFSQFPFENNSEHPWLITTRELSPTGTYDYCMMSGNSGIGSSSSAISATHTFNANGYICFDAKCNGEGQGSGWDKCIFYIDGEGQFSYGERGDEWIPFFFPVTAGTHTFMWEYSKDSTVNPDGDAFFVDNIMFLEEGRDDDLIVGVKDIKDSKDLHVIYNLAGQRIGKLQKGINIIGNQKVLVK